MTSSRRLLAAASFAALGVAALHAAPHHHVKHAAPVKHRKHASTATTAAPDVVPPRPTPTAASRGEQRQPIERTSKNPTAKEVGKVEAHALFPEPWQSLAECESIGDQSWRPDSASTYRGYFQFLPSTWRSVGGTGDPADATPAEQLQRARILQARDGWSPWPVCSREVGLR